MLHVAVWFAIMFFFMDVGSNPAKVIFRNLNFDNNTFVRILLYSE